MDDHITRCGTIGSCQSAATSEIVKALLVTSLTHVSGAIASVQTFCTASFFSPPKTTLGCARTVTGKCKKKSLFRSAEENEIVIRNPHADPDHHQKFITFRESPLARVC